MSSRGGLYTIAAAAKRLGENEELVDIVLSNPDNVDYGVLTHIDDGSEDGIAAITARGIESAEELLADVRTWPGGIRQFLIDDQCDPETLERIMADEAKR